MYLSTDQLQRFKNCAMRRFGAGERHVTRTYHKSVLILMFSGVLRFTEDGRDIELSPGEYYIQRQGLFQEGRETSDLPEYFYVEFDGSFSERDGLPLRGSFSPTAALPHVRLLERRYRAWGDSPFSRNGLFYNLLGCLDEPRASARSDDAERIALSIAERYAEPGFSIKQLVKQLPYSEDNAIRLFRKVFGTTPYRYVTKLRIDRAKQQLLYSAKSLGEIAYECGYSDYSVFYKNFVRETGVAPGSWLAHQEKESRVRVSG